MGAAVGDSGAAARAPVAGDLELGERFLQMVDKTRYPPGGVSAEAVQEIRRIKARVDAERLPRGADPNTHTKLGRGGLADIEWTVQLLQLRHAHKVPALHNTSTLETLDAIGAAELIAEGDVELLRQAWLTATRARNALVLVRGKPTDQLPGPGRQLNAVALAAGWDSDDGGEFLDNYLRVTRGQRRWYERCLALEHGLRVRRDQRGGVRAPARAVRSVDRGAAQADRRGLCTPRSTRTPSVRRRRRSRRSPGCSSASSAQ